LAHITAGQPEHFLKKQAIALAAFVTQTQIKLNDAVDNRLFEVIRDFRPREISVNMAEWISTPVRERGIRSVASGSLLEARDMNGAPKARLNPLVPTVLILSRRELSESTQLSDFRQPKWADFKALQSSGKAVVAQLDPQR